MPAALLPLGLEYFSYRACWWCAWGNALAGRSLCNVNEDGGHALGASKITLHNDRGCSSLLVEFCRICGWHIWVWLNYELKRCGFRCFVLVCILVSLGGWISCWYSVVLERGRFMVEPFSEWVVVSSNMMYALCVVKWSGTTLNPTTSFRLVDEWFTWYTLHIHMSVNLLRCITCVHGHREMRRYICCMRCSVV